MLIDLIIEFIITNTPLKIFNFAFVQLLLKFFYTSNRKPTYTSHQTHSINSSNCSFNFIVLFPFFDFFNSIITYKISCSFMPAIPKRQMLIQNHIILAQQKKYCHSNYF